MAKKALDLSTCNNIMAFIIYVLTTEMAFGLAPFSFPGTTTFNIMDNGSNHLQSSSLLPLPVSRNEHGINGKLEPSKTSFQNNASYYTDTWNDVWCRGRADNYASADFTFKCRRYFRCSGGKKSVYLCPGKLVFNGQRCVYPSEYICTPPSDPSAYQNKTEAKPKDCEGRTDGYYQDPESGCRSYFFCSNGLKATYVCPGKTLFDGNKCVDHTSYKCPFASVDCQGLGTGYFADTTSGCRRYYFCNDGNKLITLTCSDGRLFNGKRCVDPAQYRCSSTENSNAENTSSYPDSYYAYSQQIQRKAPVSSISLEDQPPYFISSRNSGTVNIIRSSSSTDSPNNEMTTTASTTKASDCENNYGFFVVKGTKCQHYYFCIGGSRTDLTCSGNTLFNGQVCVDPSQYSCPETIHSSETIKITTNHDEMNTSEKGCQGKPDGVYVDRESNCRNYYLCMRGLQTNYSCPQSQLFDGRRCVDNRKVSCENQGSSIESRSTGDFHCLGRVSGLYPDPNSSNCRGYIYCRVNRRWASAECAQSERFSWQFNRCVPKHEVNCSSDVIAEVRNSHVLQVVTLPTDSISEVTETNNEAVMVTTDVVTGYSHAHGS